MLTDRGTELRTGEEAARMGLSGTRWARGSRSRTWTEPGDFTKESLASQWAQASGSGRSPPAPWWLR